MRLALLISFIFTANHYAESARILAAVPTPAFSHQTFFQLLWRKLAINGHEVVVLTTNPTYENLTNLKEIDISAAYANVFQKGIADILELNDDKIAAVKRIIDLTKQITEYELALPEVQQLIQNEDEHFDLVMIEYLFPTFFALKHRFNCSFIGVTSLDPSAVIHNILGNPAHPILYSSWLLSAQVDSTFKERLIGFAFNILEDVMQMDLHRKMNELNKKYLGDGYPDSLEIAESVDMLFINNNPMFTPVRPLSPNTISLAGGLHMRAPKPLPDDLKDFLDASTQGVIYFSLGTMVQSKALSNATLNTILKTFSEVPYNVLWKFEDDELPGKSDNVKIIQWAPQQDVLRHKNIKLFICQAGMQSLEEALFSHVPLIMIPFFGDQDGNAEKVANKQLGINLNYRTLTVDKFRDSILEVITNPKYKNNMKQLAVQIEDQPMPALEKAVWWTEYVLRHNGAKHLRGPKIPTYQYYYLDILTLLVGCLLFVCVALYFMGKFVYKSVVRLARRFIIKFKRS